MDDLTAGELWARQGLPEDAPARALGHMLFEFSRLDVSLGLCAVWVEEGRRLEELNPYVSEMSFHKRLEFVEKPAAARFSADSEAGQAYQTWFKRAHALRVKRNEVVHGRWGVEPSTNQVVNVLGLPTSAEHRAVKYAIQELDRASEELRSLQNDFQQLRKKWPP